MRLWDEIQGILKVAERGTCLNHGRYLKSWPILQIFFRSTEILRIWTSLDSCLAAKLCCTSLCIIGVLKKTDLKKLPKFSPSDVLKPHFSQRKKPIRFLDSSPRAFKPTAPLCQGTSDTLACARKALFFAEFGERLPTTTLLSTNWGFMDALNHQLNLFNILTFWPSMINLLKEMDYTLMIISLFVLLRFHIAIHDGHETPEWEANPSSCKRNIKYMDTSKKHKTRTRCWIWNKGHGWMHLRDSQNQVWFRSIHPYIYTYEQI